MKSLFPYRAYDASAAATSAKASEVPPFKIQPIGEGLHKWCPRVTSIITPSCLKHLMLNDKNLAKDLYIHPHLGQRPPYLY